MNLKTYMKKTLILAAVAGFMAPAVFAMDQEDANPYGRGMTHYSVGTLSIYAKSSSPGFEFLTESERSGLQSILTIIENDRTAENKEDVKEKLSYYSAAAYRNVNFFSQSTGYKDRLLNLGSPFDWMTKEHKKTLLSLIPGGNSITQAEADVFKAQLNYCTQFFGPSGYNNMILLGHSPHFGWITDTQKKSLKTFFPSPDSLIKKGHVQILKTEVLRLFQQYTESGQQWMGLTVENLEEDFRTLFGSRAS